MQTLSLDLHLIRRALLVVGAAAVLLGAFFAAMFGMVLIGDHDKPQFPHELVIAVTGFVYFGALAFQTWRGIKQALDESALAHTIRLLAQSVLGMFVPVALAAIFMLWFLFQPAY